jgi:hypothetical protein
MKNIARESIRSVFGNIDPNKKDNTFEVSLSFNVNFYRFWV